jgi:hypothetical protein
MNTRNAEDAPKTVGKPRGPYIEIDQNKVYELAFAGNPDTDIARIVGCSVDTLNRRLQETLDLARAERRAELRNLQWKSAMKGDKTMLIWLGKQELDQTDRMTNETNFDTFEVIIGSKDNNNTAPLTGPTEVLEIGPAD